MAPMRHLSLTRLELQTAVTSVRSEGQIIREHKFMIIIPIFGGTGQQYYIGSATHIANNNFLCPIELLRY